MYVSDPVSYRWLGDLCQLDNAGFDNTNPHAHCASRSDNDTGIVSYTKPDANLDTILRA